MKPKSRVLNIEQLLCQGRDVHEEQAALFLKLFGRSVRVTEKLCVAHASEFHWNCAANYLLSAPADRAWQEVVDPAYKAYVAVTEPIYWAYRQRRVIANEAYQKGKVTAKARKKAMDKADKIWEKGIDKAEKVLSEALASAWARLYISDKVGP